MDNIIAWVDESATISDYVDDWAACFHAPARPETAAAIELRAVERFGPDEWMRERQSRV